MIRSISAALALLVAFTFSLTTARAFENTWDYSVQVSSSVQVSPAKVTLTWPQDTNGVPSSYTVYRKSPSSTSWGAGTTLSGNSTTYTDTGVSSGQTYEYRIVKAAASYTATATSKPPWPRPWSTIAARSCSSSTIQLRPH